jgi:hypothetical protein
MADDTKPPGMSEYEQPSELRASRRREVFRAIRGSKLTGQRGTDPQSGHRVRLWSAIEDESDGGAVADAPRYSEPND